MSFRSFYPLIATAALTLVGCDRPVDDRVDLGDSTRGLREDVDRPAAIDASSSDRFPMPKRTGSRGPLKWEVPDGWASLEAGGMRMGDFRFGDQGEGECYIASFPGGGAVLDNVNRWRGQLALEPVDAAAVQAMPTVEMLGSPATFFDESGTYTGMLDPTPKPEQRMLGAILTLDDSRAMFVKLVAPAAMAAEQRDNFISLCQSIRFDPSAVPAP